MIQMIVNEIDGSRSKPYCFWGSQFAGPATAKQTVFDWLFGVLLPVLCLIFDPGVFNPDGILIFASLQNVRLFGYLEIGLGAGALTYYLLTRNRSLFLAGALYVGAIFSVVLGVLIFPDSALGLLFLIGIFGFTPFLTAFVFCRSAIRCQRDALAQLQESNRRHKPVLKLILSAVLTLAVPAAAQITLSAIANRAMKTLLTTNHGDGRTAVRTLKLVRVAMRTDDLVEAFQRATDQAERDRIASAYQQITGHSIERVAGPRD